MSETVEDLKERIEELEIEVDDLRHAVSKYSELVDLMEHKLHRIRVYGLDTDQSARDALEELEEMWSDIRGV